MKKVLAVILCIMTVFFAVPFGTAATAEGEPLRFNKDGTFRILVFADCQDDKTPDSSMIEAMNQLLDLNRPDIVVFTGDNVVENNLAEFTKGLKALLAPVTNRNIPYAFTFGNHDDEGGVSKEDQFSVYRSTGRCLTTDPVPSLTGLGTCNIPVLHSGSDKMAFNLWMVDSNTYDRTNGGYDHVHSDQTEWLLQKQQEITAAEGGVVNSLIFQHIIVPEITSCLTESASGAWSYNGRKYDLRFNENGSGMLYEHPCPPTVNGGEYAAAVNMGGVLGIVSGHDHNNDFVAKPGSVDLIQVGGMTYNSYGTDRVRGASLITLNENDTSVYSVRRFLNTKLFAGDYGYVEKEPVYVQEQGGKTYISEITAAAAGSAASAMSQLTGAGYTPIDFDLNKGAGGDYIYFGYKTTTDISQAITGFRVLSATKDPAAPSVKEFRGVSYQLASSVDLNAGAGGDYIYLYFTKQAGAGAPVTEVIVNQTANTAGYTPAGTFECVPAADLNKNAKGAYIYLQSCSSLPVLDPKAFIASYEAAMNADTAGKAPEKAEALEKALADAKTVYDSLVTACRTTAAQNTLNTYTSALENALKSLDLPHVHTPGAKVTENDLPSTCAKAGNCDEVVYCTVCKAEISRTKVGKPLAAHTPGAKVTENAVPATCTGSGLYEEAVYCTVCKAEISRTSVVTDPAAHTDGNGDGYCDVCGADMPVNCSHLCHKTGFLGFIWKIVNFFNKLFKINRYCACGAAHW